MERVRTYSEGDWIVHTRYGIGQIKGVDLKNISGEETRYYRVITTNSTYWVPVDQMDSEVLRPLSTPEDIQKAITALQKPPKEMSQNYKTRQSRIQRVEIRNTPRAIARLIRDLRERQREKGALNKTERSAFRSLRQRLIEEWAIVIGATTENVELKLNTLLNPDQSANGESDKTAVAQETAAASAASPVPQYSKWGTWPKRQTNKINR